MNTMTSPAAYVSTADRIRAALKAAGYKANQVSVKSTSGGSIRVTIRSASVRIGAISEIANSFERISRDGFGEILGGGNTFVDVEYTKEALAPLVAEISAALSAAKANHGVQVGPHLAFWEPSYGVTETPDHNSTICTTSYLTTGSCLPMRASGLAYGAQTLAVDLLNRGILSLATAT